LVQEASAASSDKETQSALMEKLAESLKVKLEEKDAEAKLMQV